MLTARGGGVLEDMRTKKRRPNPARGQRWNFGKLNGRGRCADQRRMRSMIVTARCDHRHRAIVFDATRILVDALMQLRGRTQRKRAEKCRGDANRNERAPLII